MNDDGFLGGEHSALKVGIAIAAGAAAIAATLAALAMASARFDFGPRMAPVAYILIAIVAVVLLVNFLVTLINNETLAGFYLRATWAITLSSAFMVFHYFR